MNVTVRAVRDAVDVPIIVDADTGFGNAVSTYRAVQLLEAAGADGIQLEDQQSPKRCGHFDGTTVVSASEHAAKIAAAREGLRNPSTVIIARTDARAALGLDAAVDRANLYLKMGADVAFVEGLRSFEEIVQVSQSVHGHQVINMVEGGVTPLHFTTELRELGFSMILFANLCLQASVRGVQQVLEALRERDSLADVGHLLVPWAERQELARKPRFDVLDQRYGELTSQLADDDAAEQTAASDNHSTKENVSHD